MIEQNTTEQYRTVQITKEQHSTVQYSTVTSCELMMHFKETRVLWNKAICADGVFN